MDENKKDGISKFADCNICLNKENPAMCMMCNVANEYSNYLNFVLPDTPPYE